VADFWDMAMWDKCSKGEEEEEEDLRRFKKISHKQLKTVAWSSSSAF